MGPDIVKNKFTNVPFSIPRGFTGLGLTVAVLSAEITQQFKEGLPRLESKVLFREGDAGNASFLTWAAVAIGVHIHSVTLVASTSSHYKLGFEMLPKRFC